jgi:DNA-binding response OmpR family regulator
VMSNLSNNRELAEERNVLVMDDEDKFCDLIKRFLTKTRCFTSIVTAENGMVGWQKMNNQSFSLVIMDQVMPVRNGLDVITRMRSDSKFQNIEIILMSGHLQETDVIRAMNLGIKHILAKPFTKSVLLEKVYDIFPDLLPSVEKDRSQKSDD